MKITIIGAGSAVFWISMMRDLCLMDSINGATISLVDINAERLDAVYDLGSRFASEVGANVKFEKSSDRRKSLRDSQYILNTALVGGHDVTEKIRSIGEKHGYYRGIEQHHPQFIRAYYQFKLAMDIASDILDICPDAWLLQVANPVFDITTLLHRQKPKLKFAGFCDGFNGGYRQLLFALGFSPAEVDYQVAGFNHCIWLTRFFFKESGASAYPNIDRWIKDESQRFWKEHELGLWQETMSPAAVDLYRIYGLYPIGDTMREYNYKYHFDLDTLKRWFGPIGGTDSEIGNPLRLQDFQNNVDTLFKLTNDPKASVTAEITPTKGSDQFADFIDAMELGKEMRGPLNVPNNGTIPQLPDNVTIEVAVKVKNKRLNPERPDPFPKPLLDFVLMPKMLKMEWALDAYLSGDRNLLLEILMRDERTRSEKQARDALEEILSLPENSEVAEHYS
jgi:alpha-galactosidase